MPVFCTCQFQDCSGVSVVVVAPPVSRELVDASAAKASVAAEHAAMKDRAIVLRVCVISRGANKRGCALTCTAPFRAVSMLQIVGLEPPRSRYLSLPLSTMYPFVCIVSNRVF